MGEPTCKCGHNSHWHWEGRCHMRTEGTRDSICGCAGYFDTPARAVVDAVETEADAMAEDRAMHAWDTSPARDDAEKAIAGLLAEHRELGSWRVPITTRGPLEHSTLMTTERRVKCSCGLTVPSHQRHLASVIAAHMAAPDELTALPPHEKALRKLWREVAEKGIEQGVDWPRIVLTLFADIDQLVLKGAKV